MYNFSYDNVYFPQAMMSTSPNQLPSVVNEHQVNFFNFYQDGLVKEGMRYGCHLFGKAYTFDSGDRLAAFDFANQLASTGCQTVITVSKQAYTIWVGLRADEYPHWSAMIKGLVASMQQQATSVPA